KILTVLSETMESLSTGNKSTMAGMRMRNRVAITLTVAVISLAGLMQRRSITALQETTAAFDLEETTIRTLIQDQQSGRRTARQISSAYIARIQALDRSGPALHSVIELNPDALTIADALDAERVAGRLRGPLHGVPVLIKDNIDTGDRMMTTAGSLAVEGSIASRDALIVEQLRAAGAVILGKTDMSEWANFRSARSTSGWSGRGGLVKNPYAL